MSQITVSGHLFNLSGSATQGSVVFTLTNYGDNVPRVIGTNAIAPVSQTFSANASGFWTGTVQGNDSIDPGASNTPPTTYYSVTFVDASGKVIQSLPFNFTGVGPANLDSQAPLNPLPVITTPNNAGLLAANQTWTGINTFTGANVLTAQSVEGYLYADQYTGSDIGAKINAAIAALPSGATTGGTVLIRPNAYSFSTTIVKPRNVNLDFGGSFLTYTGSTQAIVVGDNTTGVLYQVGSLRNLRLVGPGNTGTTIGVYCGGDPAGIISASANQCIFQQFDNVSVSAFKYGYQYGNNAYLNTWIAGDIEANNVGLYLPSGLSGGGEISTLLGTQINNNTGPGIQCDGFAQEIAFIGGALDYNGNGTGPAISGQQGNFNLTNVHLEQTSGYLIDIAETGGTNWFMTIHGGELVLTGTTGTTTAFIKVAGSGGLTQFWCRDSRFGVNIGQTVSQYINFTSTGGSYYLANPIWIGPGTKPVDHVIKETFESNNFLMRDLSTAGQDAWWFSMKPLGSSPEIDVFGGANLGASPVFKVAGQVSATNEILTAAAPTVAAAQVGLGATTATTATAGANGDVPAQVVGYLIINVAGTTMKVPYYNT